MSTAESGCTSSAANGGNILICKASLPRRTLVGPHISMMKYESTRGEQKVHFDNCTIDLHKKERASGEHNELHHVKSNQVNERCCCSSCKFLKRTASSRIPVRQVFPALWWLIVWYVAASRCRLKLSFAKTGWSERKYLIPKSCTNPRTSAPSCCSYKTSYLPS